MSLEFCANTGDCGPVQIRIRSFSSRSGKDTPACFRIWQGDKDDVRRSVANAKPLHYGGIEDLGRPVEKLMLEWMNPFLTGEEMDRLVGWHLGVSV